MIIKKRDNKEIITMGRVLLNAENITKTYSNRRGDNTVLDGLSLQIEEGKFYAIEGESGSGKSTLLSILSGLQKPNDGVVEYTPDDENSFTISEMDDDELTRLRRHDIVYVPQSQEVLPNLNVIDNICLVDWFDEKKSKEKKSKEKTAKSGKFESKKYGLEKNGNAELEDISRLSLILDQLGISELGREYPSVLSGGELRRLCIARTLYAEPKIILADEPTNDLDKDNRDKLRTIFRDIADKGVAVVIVTHDTELAEEADERIRL